MWRETTSARLFDLTAQASASLQIETPGAQAATILFGAADLAPAVRAAPVRYVCDPSFSELCYGIIDDVRLLGRSADLVRVGAPRIWVEWRDEAAARSIGALVTANENGRSGSVEFCWSSHEAGEGVDVSPVVAEFDFGDRQFGLKAAADIVDLELDRNDPARSLLRHVRFRIRRDWLRYYVWRSKAQTLRPLLREAAGMVAPDFVYVCAAMLVLIADGPVAQRIVGVGGKTRLGGPGFELPDHIELSAVWGAERGNAARQGEPGAGKRRLHSVRGHFVRWRDRLYWRRPHFRGDATIGAIKSRTVMLKGR
ncbi:MAG: hypothetical protein AB7G40_17760 [Hyphomonadaceae bacterium]